MEGWTSLHDKLPREWEMVIALDRDENYYLVEWDPERKCFWEQGSRFPADDFSCWTSIPEPPMEAVEALDFLRAG